MCDNQKECDAARNHGWRTPPVSPNTPEFEVPQKDHSCGIRASWDFDDDPTTAEEDHASS